MKKVLSILLALTMCLSMFAFTASAETSDNLLVNPSFEDGMNGWVSPDGKGVLLKAKADMNLVTEAILHGLPRHIRKIHTFIRMFLLTAETQAKVLYFL